MELIAYIRLFRKWFWLLFLGAFLAAGAAYLFRSNEPDVYTASVTVSVGGIMDAPNPDLNDLYTGVQLVENYAVLAKTFDVLEAAVEAGNFPMSPDALGGLLSTRIIENTSLLVLQIQYTDPVLAADMVNEVARQLIINSPTNLTPEQQSQIDLASAEIDRLREELQQLRLQLNAIDSQLATTIDPVTAEDLREQRTVIADQVIQTSSNIAQFSANITALQRRTNSLDIVEGARVPTTPIGSSVFSQVILAAIVGGALAAGVALLIEYLDDTIHSPEEATQTLAMPTLAAITRFGKTRDAYSQRLITFRDPGSPISEEYRTLRTNLLFSSNGSVTKGVYIVTSPGPSEGKSVTTANLAVTMAMAGWRVLVIDADLRRPRMHEVFELENSVGLSTLLAVDPGESFEGTGKANAQQTLTECIHPTEIPNLSVITSGYIPLNPTEVLGSVAMQRWFQELQASGQFDIILFDTPPVLVVADSLVLASTLDVPLVLVIEAGQTRRGAAVRAKEQLTQLGISVSGLVLNAVNPRDKGGYGYGYDYYYYYSDSKPGAQK
jgi:polysaccharide biosynthesis transport protein